MFDRPPSAPLPSLLLNMPSGSSSKKGKAKAEAKAPVPPPYLTTTPKRHTKQPVLDNTPVSVKSSSLKVSKDFLPEGEVRGMAAQEMDDRFAPIGYEGFIKLMLKESESLGDNLLDITREEFQAAESLTGPLDKLQNHPFTQTEYHDYPILVSSLLDIIGHN